MDNSSPEPFDNSSAPSDSGIRIRTLKEINKFDIYNKKTGNLQISGSDTEENLDEEDEDYDPADGKVQIIEDSSDSDTRTKILQDEDFKKTPMKT